MYFIFNSNVNNKTKHQIICLLFSECTIIPSSTDDPREKDLKSCKHRLDRKGKPLEVKRETEEPGTGPEVMYDFLNPDEDGD